jgi:hypothetical protein
MLFLVWHWKVLRSVKSDKARQQRGGHQYFFYFVHGFSIWFLSIECFPDTDQRPVYLTRVFFNLTASFCAFNIPPLFFHSSREVNSTATQENERKSHTLSTGAALTYGNWVN